MKIPNNKHQKTNNNQNPMNKISNRMLNSLLEFQPFENWKFKHWYLFVF